MDRAPADNENRAIHRIARVECIINLKRNEEVPL